MNQNKIIEARIKIGELLKNKRIAISITKMALSEKTGLTRATIDNIENAYRSYHIDSYIIYLEGVK
jgi:transcriptional regulator with XRE-family HTH domain